MHNGEQRGEPKLDLESLVWLLRGHDQLAEAWLDLADKRAVPFPLFTGVRGRRIRGSSNTGSCMPRVPWSRMMIRGPILHERRGLHVVVLNRYAEM